MKLYKKLMLIMMAAATFAKAEESKPAAVHYDIEMQSTAASGNVPLWLNANKHGLSSIKGQNGYLRAGVFRALDTEIMNSEWSDEDMKKTDFGYGLDLVAAHKLTSKLIVQQAFVEGRWLNGTLTIGSKEQPLELKNNALSSGSQTLGINARPVPQVRIALPRYWTLPFAGRWLHLKGHIAYGMMTDDNWQHDFTRKQSKYADNVLYHSKAGYLKIGNEERFCPLSLEIGLEMASLFGGTSYSPQEDGTTMVVKGHTGFNAFWNAFIPGGAEPNETTYQNAEGNQVGSWVMRINYDTETWRLGVYADKYFEDHSAMFQLDYDGYGSGDEWQVKKDNRYVLYDFKDIMLGAELNMKYGSWLKDIVVEYLYSKYQSGPIYHDHTQTIPDHIGGNDDFYNHYIYTGWQHWGQVIGNPLYRSPIYNTDGKINIQNNRMTAFHLGISGEPTERLSYRILGTYQEGLGTYENPYDKQRHNVSFLTEASYKKAGWNITAAYAMDFGSILGHNYGGQISIKKTF